MHELNDELDRQLEELVLQVQSYINTTPKDQYLRQKTLHELWDTMFPSSSLNKGRSPKPTDSAARRRLDGVRKECNDRYGSKLKGDFEQDWADVLQEVQIEICKKIDIYKRGVDYKIYKDWQEFCKKNQENPTSEICSEFQNQIEKFRCRFLKRRIKKGFKKAQSLEQACLTFGSKIENSEVDLQQSWNNFCDEVQKLYDPFKFFWNWVAFHIQNRFIDLIRKRLRENQVADELASNAFVVNEEDTNTQKRFAPIQTKANKKLSKGEIKIIREDPDGIFRGKHIENYPNVNFREIAILKFKGATLEEMNRYFNHQVDAQKTISPFYTRKRRYFQPIIEEYLEARLSLPENVLTDIINDETGKFQRKKMPGYPSINFQSIILRRIKDVPSWTIMARNLQIPVKELIYFYLDCVSFFKLIQTPKNLKT